MRTRFVLFALEEAGLPYESRIRPPGCFARELKTAGPVVTDGLLRFLERNAAVRHIAQSSKCLTPQTPHAALDAETWLELQATWLRPAGVRIREAAQRGDRDTDSEQTFNRCLIRHERALEHDDYLVGEFSVANCTATLLLACRAAGEPFSFYPALAASLDRIEQRPVWQRAAVRADELHKPCKTESPQT
ncbi:MAG: glutathione S-transferase family protein [Acidobacteriota bacterium]|nr:MAG: glutathione S-transferase family protein [Acidobacteriota bacterium]